MVKRICTFCAVFLVTGFCLLLAAAGSLPGTCLLVSASTKTMQWTEEEHAFIAAHPIIRLGVDPKFTPYEFMDNDGIYKGISADYLRLISARTGLTFVPERGLTWTEAYEKAVRKELDMLPCVSRTAERERYFQFSESFYQFTRVILIQEDNKSVGGLADLAGQSVAVQKNSSHEGFLKLHPEITAHLYPTVEDALTALSDGRETAFIGNYATSLYLSRTLGFTHLKVVKLASEEPQKLYLAVRNDWPVLVDILNKALASITEEEKIEINNRWIDVAGETDYSDILRIVVISGAILIGICLISLFWILQLRREITMRKKVEIALKDAKVEAETANQVKSSFLARMSHEIRTPLNAITGMAYLMRRNGISESQNVYLEKIIQASRNMLGIINDILDFSKIEAGKLDIEVIPFNLDTVLQQSVAILSAKVEEQGIRLEIFKDPSVPVFFLGDPTRIGQILLNLMNNAAKFTSVGAITLSVTYASDGEKPPMLELAVSDTGIGMSKAQLETLFIPFKQADDSITRRFGGTGLGLSIVKSLTEMMGGAIQVDSVPNKGSTFRIRLPLMPDTHLEDEERVRANPMRLKEIRTLVLDTDPDRLSFLARYLDAFHMDARCVLTKSEATECLRAVHPRDGQPYDLLILDQEATGVEGLGYIDAIHQDLRIRQKPKCIMLLPMLREDLLAQIKAHHVDLGLFKPLIASVLYNGILLLFQEQVTENRQDPAQQAVPLTIGADNSCHVLLVEDNKINQEIAQFILEEAGFTVSLADDGKQGVEAFLARRDEIDVILMDLHMPVMNGYDATKRIREVDTEVPIVAMTADAISGVEAECTRYGLDAYVSKPYEPESFIAVMVGLMDRVRANRANRAPVNDKSFLAFAMDDAGSQAPSDAPNPADEGQQSDAGLNAPLPEAIRTLLADAEKLPILDEADGLRRLGNNSLLLKRVLAEFKRETEENLPTLDALLSGHDYAEAAHSVHKIKGGAGNIGARRVHLLASGFQKALESGDSVIIPPFTELFMLHLRALLASLTDRE